MQEANQSPEKTHFLCSLPGFSGVAAGGGLIEVTQNRESLGDGAPYCTVMVRLRSEEWKDAALFLGFVFEWALGANAVFIFLARIDLALLRQADAMHMKWLRRRTFDDEAGRVDDLCCQLVRAPVDVLQGKNRVAAGATLLLTVE